METVKHLLDIDTKEIVNKILAMRDLWISRSKDYPFYTLGRSAYLDGKTDAYYKDSEWQNDILLGEFGELYEKVIDVLQEELEEPVELAHDLSIPGFHIFPSDPKFLTIAGKWHMDFPHTTLELGDEDPYAFTVAIQLPNSGGGMDWIDDKGIKRHLSYKEKELVLHSGLDTHRIAGMKKYVPEEYRITLQGHLIRRNKTMEVFW
tara:strand:- start:6 stop:620 length:615 start_codon:yes stop_codon:yes gene_type:complete